MTEPHTAGHTRQQVRRVLIITLLLNLIVAVGKLGVGASAGVLAIVADGFHSLTDAAGNIVALVTNHIAAKPPDDDHPYGHRRFETIGALVLGLLLLLTAWEIGQSVFSRLGGAGQTPQPTPLTLVVLAATLVINIGVSTYQRREGKRLRAELLLADAANTRADVYVTLSVLVSTLAVAAGYARADALAALFVAVLIARAAWDVLRSAGGVLVDKAPYEPAQLAAWVYDVPAVETVVRARSRGPQDAAHIDIDVQTAPAATTRSNEAVAAAIREQLTEQVRAKGGTVAEVEVHFAPHNTGESDYLLTARARAEALGLAAHDVRVYPGDAGVVLQMHVEVPPQQTLQAAHAQATELEQAVKRSLPDVAEVVTHIEPVRATQQAPLVDADCDRSTFLRQRVGTILITYYPDVAWHALRIYADADGYSLTVHAALTPETSIERAHEIAEHTETLLRAEVAELQRVTIHTEPINEAD